MPFPQPRSRKEVGGWVAGESSLSVVVVVAVAVVGGLAGEVDEERVGRMVGRKERSFSSARESENQVVPVSSGFEAWFSSSLV